MDVAKETRGWVTVPFVRGDKQVAGRSVSKVRPSRSWSCFGSKGSVEIWATHTHPYYLKNLDFWLDLPQKQLKHPFQIPSTRRTVGDRPNCGLGC